MDEKEFDELTKQFGKVTHQDAAKVTLPPGADAEDIAGYLRLAKNGKQLLTRANASGDAAAASTVKAYLAELKRVARARAMQRELARLERRQNPVITPFPELDPHLFSPRRAR